MRTEREIERMAEMNEAAMTKINATLKKVREGDFGPELICDLEKEQQRIAGKLHMLQWFTIG